MGRPSKLSERQWGEIGRRLVDGERVRALAKEFKIGASTISDRFSEQNRTIKLVANQLASAEAELSRLPPFAQITARGLANDLRDISNHIIGAAKYGAMTAHRMGRIANMQAQKVDEVSPMESADILQTISVLTKMGNEAAAVGLGIIKSNQDAISRDLASSAEITKIERVIVHPANTNA
jgi:hypothetical protein